MLSLTIDGRQVSAAEGQTILDVVESQGVKLPILCNDEQLRPFTSCWLCVVDVEGARGFVPACGTKVTNGMKISTDSERVRLARKMCLGLLLSNHYGDCIAPCRLECPASVDIQGYLSLIALGQYDRATELIRERLPMPASIGRICPHPCESACRRNLVDEPVSICSLKRFAADNARLEKPAGVMKPTQSKKVAVIGGGPAGLSAAHFLAKFGYGVTIFEAMPELGGMLRYGIPEYRLPKAVLDAEIDAIISSGCVEVKAGRALGRHFTLDELTEKMGYDAVFLAIGAWGNRNLGVDGENSEGVLSGIAFLRDVSEGRPLDLSGKRVAVVGGGNTAMDAARTAVRLGASEVSIVYRRSRDEMPACKGEIAEAEHEGVKIRLLEAPKRVLSENGKVAGLECIRMVLGEPDSSGRRRPEAVPNSEFTIGLDYIVAAIGQKPIMPAGGVKSPKVDGRSGSLCVDDSTFQTSAGGIFSGGDAISGGGIAAKAIANGRKAAFSMDRYLQGKPMDAANNEEEKELLSVSSKTDLVKPEEFADVQKVKRAVMPTLKERKNFMEVDIGFGREQATTEALRCMACGCDDILECSLRRYAIEYGESGDAFEWGERKKYPRDIRHPFIKKEQGKCILCGRCVRICDEVMGLDSISFAKRGFDAVISTDFDRRLQDTNCVSCGQCVATCPTGALSENFASLELNCLAKSGPWTQEKLVGSICPYCGVGCAMDLHVLSGPMGSYVVKVTSKGGPANPHGNLCVKGRFGFSFVNGAERLRKPFVRDWKGGKFREAEWDEAISIVAKKLKTAKPPEASMFVSHRCTNEEASLADELFASAYGSSRNTGSFFSSGGPPPSNKFDMKKLDKADLMVVCGDPSEMRRKYPVVFLRARSARLAPVEGAEKLFEASKNPVLLFEGDDPAAGRAVELFTSHGKGDCILALHEKCNSVGVGLAVGARGEELLLDGRTKMVYVLGEDPLGCAADAGHKEKLRSALDSLDFFVVQDMFMTETAKLADVVLPASSFAETEGTFTNSAGLTQKLNKAMEPPSGMENKDILMAVGSAMGLGKVDMAPPKRQPKAGGGGARERMFSNGCDHVDRAFERKIRELGLVHPETEKP